MVDEPEGSMKQSEGRTDMVERCTRALCIAVILLQAAYQLI
jgi:hypothetical protein